MLTSLSSRTIVLNKRYITDKSACSIIGIYRAANLIPYGLYLSALLSSSVLLTDLGQPMFQLIRCH